MPTIAAESADAWLASAGTVQHFAASGSSAFCGIRIFSMLRHPDLHHFAASESAAFCGIRICSI
jgi:hypothetical protein